MKKIKTYFSLFYLQKEKLLSIPTPKIKKHKNFKIISVLVLNEKLQG